MADNEGSVVDPQTKTEEAANSISHGLAAALSIAGLVLLAVFASRKGDAWKITSLSIYGASLVGVNAYFGQNRTLRLKSQ